MYSAAPPGGGKKTSVIEPFDFTWRCSGSGRRGCTSPKPQCTPLRWLKPEKASNDIIAENSRVLEAYMFIVIFA